MRDVNEIPGLTWDWTLDTWNWTPREERWSPAIGAPKGCVFIEMTTQQQSPEEAFGFWRDHVFYLYDVEDGRLDKRPRFEGHISGLVSNRGHFYVYGFDRTIGARTESKILADNGSDVDFGIVVDGHIHEQLLHGAPASSGPGQPIFTDLAQPTRVTWDVRRAMHLRLTREPVEAALGGPIPPSDVMHRALASSPLWPFWRSHMLVLGDAVTSLSEYERSAMLDHAVDIALTTLRGIGAGLHRPTSSQASHDTLFDAARRYINTHLPAHDLTPSTVAQAIGCSRTTLYRIFSDHELTVSGYIKEQRLQRLAQLLRTAPAYIPLAILSERCGFADPRTARTNFRRRFGTSPSQVRRTKHAPVHPS